MSNLTQSRLKELLEYDPETGSLKWRVNRGRAVAGAEAGCDSQNYRDIRVDGEQHRIHRVIFLLVYGRWPAHHIDHINGNPKDNRLCNLREVTNSENLRNARRWSHNTSRIAGVFWNSSKRKWTAKIKVHGKSIHLGHFDRKIVAAVARRAAEIKYGFSDRHGAA